MLAAGLLASPSRACNPFYEISLAGTSEGTTSVSHGEVLRAIIRNRPPGASRRGWGSRVLGQCSQDWGQASETWQGKGMVRACLFCTLNFDILVIIFAINLVFFFKIIVLIIEGFLLASTWSLRLILLALDYDSLVGQLSFKKKGRKVSASFYFWSKIFMFPRL